MKIDRSRYYRVHEVANLLSCHKTTVYRLCKRGKLPPLVQISGKLNVMAGDKLDDVLNQAEREAA